MLVVDDDESIREYLRMLLEQAGYSVIAVENGAVALAYLRRVRTDLVVLDLMMPVLDGWAVAEAMQRDPQLCRVPIIAFTAAGERAPAGVAATLVKPSAPEALLDAVARLLKRNRRRARRYVAALSVHATLCDQSIQATTHDVSSGGLSFDTPIAPRVGERLRLLVDLTLRGVAALEVEVRHVAAAPPGWRVGTQLLSFHANAVGFDAELAALARQRRPRPADV